MARLVEFDVALATLGMAIRGWLGERIKAAAFGGETPLQFMLAHDRNGIDQASRFILQQRPRSSIKS